MIFDAQGLGRRLVRITVGFFLIGVLLIAGSEYALITTQVAERSWSHVLLKIALDLGIAFIIASIVALIFEQLLSRERIGEISKLLGEHNEMEQFGFKKIFATRQMVFDELFEITIPNARHDLKIMGICVSLFKEARREPRPSTQSNAKRIREVIVERLLDGCLIQVLYLRRYPSAQELKNYGIAEGDFFSMRERDEDENMNFLHGKRLKKIANSSHGDWIQVFITLADRIKDNKAFRTKEARSKLFNRLQIREFFALPSVSLYIVDQEIYVTPYLYKKHCSDVPAFKVFRKDSPLYKSYESHFGAAWDNGEFTTPAIPPEFIELLIDNPHQTLEIYRRKEEEVLNDRQAQEKLDPTYNESPEYYRVEENAIQSVLKVHQVHLPQEQRV
jgi:hypothetical protein